MQQSRGLVTSQSGRFEALCSKHEALKELIREEQKHPATGGEALKRLKLKKLKIKEKIEEMRRA